MTSDLAAARERAERLRFSGDSLRRPPESSGSGPGHALGFFSQEALQIAPSVTPSLAKCIERVAYRLGIPMASLDAFVHASAEIQAECYARGESGCFIRFSSALIDLLDDEEIEFVAGHEIGHFLLGHANHGARDGSVEFFMQRRAQEISVDRVGLLACHSLDAAVRALMKTASGLSSQRLRFDVGTFLAQLRNADRSGFHGAATHPSIVVRCRALLWFAPVEGSAREGGQALRRELARVDARIERDLERFVDGPVRERIEEAKHDLTLWLALEDVVGDGMFEKSEQEVISAEFGTDVLERLKRFLAAVPAAKIKQTVHGKAVEARVQLEQIIPEGFARELEGIQQRVGAMFRS